MKKMAVAALSVFLGASVLLTGCGGGTKPAAEQTRREPV